MSWFHRWALGLGRKVTPWANLTRLAWVQARYDKLTALIHGSHGTFALEFGP